MPDARRQAAVLGRVREDVHIHVDEPTLRRWLVDVGSHGRWLARHFRDFEHDGNGGCSFTLALPMRSEAANLRRDDEEHETVTYVCEHPSDIESLTWAIHREGPSEVHLTVEAAYRPQRGPLGALLEPLVHRPHRVQALRDTLWNLKQLIERERR